LAVCFHDDFVFRWRRRVWERKVQGGADGVIQSMALNRDRQVVTYATARTVIHGGVAEERDRGGPRPHAR